MIADTFGLLGGLPPSSEARKTIRSAVALCAAGGCDKDETFRRLIALSWTVSPELFGGMTLPQIAANAGVSLATMRGHVRWARRVNAMKG